MPYLPCNFRQAAFPLQSQLIQLQTWNDHFTGLMSGVKELECMKHLNTCHIAFQISFLLLLKIYNIVFGGGLIYVSVSNVILGTQNPMSETKIFNSHFLMHDGSEVLENKVPSSRRPSSQWQHSTRPQVMGLLVMSSLINTSLHGQQIKLSIKTKVI